jgi:murein DD-endopeptidase MepM/ murein hydrolase activator NlpD
LGQTFAYDFVRVSPDGNSKGSFHSKSTLAYLFAQVKLSDCYGWGQPIFSPIDGIVREVSEGIKEREYLHIITDFGLAIINALFFSVENDNVSKVAGNHLIIEGDEFCVWIAHAKTGSIRPKVGDVVSVGEVIAEVGHSGNSTAPHLHFQLMDRVDIKVAKGLPCCFNLYERLTDDGQWCVVENGIPTSVQQIRFNENEKYSAFEKKGQ